MLYLKYQLYEFIVKFNIKFLKGSSTYDDTIFIFSFFTYVWCQNFKNTFPPQKRDIICGRPLTLFYVKLHNKFMQLIFQVNGLKFRPGSIFGPKFGPFGSIFGPALNWAKRLKFEPNFFGSILGLAQHFLKQMRKGSTQAEFWAGLKIGPKNRLNLVKNFCLGFHGYISSSSEILKRHFTKNMRFVKNLTSRKSGKAYNYNVDFNNFWFFFPWIKEILL